MKIEEIEVGKAYARADGCVRLVTKIIDDKGYVHVVAKSRYPEDPEGEWPGGVGAPLDVFAGLSVREVPEYAAS